METLLKFMIWGYPYLWKHPFIRCYHTKCFVFYSTQAAWYPHHFFRKTRYYMHHTVPHYVGFDTCQVAFSTVNHICASTSQISPCFIPTKAYKGTGWWCVVRLFDTLFITISIISFVGLPVISFEITDFLLVQESHLMFLQNQGNPHMEEKEVDDSDSSDEYYEQDTRGTRWPRPYIWDHLRQIYVH